MKKSYKKFFLIKIKSYICLLFNTKKNIMNKNLGKLIASGLDFDLFWSITVDCYGLQVRGWYSKKMENYVLARGFEKYDLYYSDNPNEFEYKKDDCRLLLTIKPK